MIKIIKINSKEYQQERELRNKVLLRPFNLPDHAWEMKDNEAIHFAKIVENKVVGCLLLWPKNNEELQLIQMAIDFDFQNQGFGKSLVIEAKTFALKNGYQSIFCHARENAINFYLSQAFNIESDFFEEVGIKHKKMRIKLSNALSN